MAYECEINDLAREEPWRMSRMIGELVERVRATTIYCRFLHRCQLTLHEETDKAADN